MLVDLSHTIEDGMVTYRGLPPPVVGVFRSYDQSRHHYAAGTEFHIGRIDMVANTGTYLDAPFHRFRQGKDISQLALDSLANLDGVAVHWDISHGQAIGKDVFERLEVTGKAVLVHTGWDQFWRTEQYFTGHPYLTPDAAESLIRSGARLVGIDSLNIDNIDDDTRPVHSLLLEAEIPIVEHLCNLAVLPDRGFRFFAVPVKVKSMGSFPVRAFAIIDQPNPASNSVAG